MIMRLIFKNVPVNVAQNVLLLLLRKKKLCSYPQQQAGPGLISYLRLNSQSDAQSTRLHPTFGKKKFKKNLILCSPLWHARKPEATKNGLSLRKACVTPVWPHRLLSPPSLLRRTQDLRRWGGKLIHFSWRQRLSVCVCFQAPFLSLTTYTRACTCSQTYTALFPLTYCPFLCVYLAYKHNGLRWSCLDSRMPFHQHP